MRFKTNQRLKKASSPATVCQASDATTCVFVCRQAHINQLFVFNFLARNLISGYPVCLHIQLSDCSNPRLKIYGLPDRKRQFVFPPISRKEQVFGTQDRLRFFSLESAELDPQWNVISFSARLCLLTKIKFLPLPEKISEKAPLD